MKKYSHAISVAFTIVNDEEDGFNTSYTELTAALATRLASLIKEPDLESFDFYDTAEIEEHEN